MTNILNLFDEHLEELRPSKKPTKEKVAAAKAAATVANSRLNHLKVALEYARLRGQKPVLPMLELPDNKKAA